ncbi:SOUL family heme-binding protein [Mycobacterium sp.]|uniref:SOUL family heme-binding protein n=1 Tax=Mycobacterium sp. TaxID=1785 RepID=UPI003D1018B6
MLGEIAGLVRGLTGAVGAIVGVRHGTEEPTYTAEQVTSRVEIRHYGPRVAAETTVTADEVAARSDGFRRLAGYIFGGNQVREKIAMTAPVVQQDGAARGEKIPMTAPVSESAAGKDEWLIRFFMPAGKSIESLPRPNDQAVELVVVPAETVAVRRFSGSTSARAVARETAQLRRTLKETGFEAIGVPAAWFYDPPWTLPVLRRNEIAIPVESHS